MHKTCILSGTLIKKDIIFLLPSSFAMNEIHSWMGCNRKEFVPQGLISFFLCRPQLAGEVKHIWQHCLSYRRTHSPYICHKAIRFINVKSFTFCSTKKKQKERCDWPVPCFKHQWSNRNKLQIITFLHVWWRFVCR